MTMFPCSAPRTCDNQSRNRIFFPESLLAAVSTISYLSVTLGYVTGKRLAPFGSMWDSSAGSAGYTLLCT